MFRQIPGIATDTLVAFFLRLAGSGLLFGFNLLLARFLGAGGAGIYFLALTLATIATVIGRMGLENSLLRFVAVGLAAGNWDQVAGVYRQGMRIAWLTSILATILLFFLSPWLAVAVFEEVELTTALRLMAISVFPMSLLGLYSELLKGIKRIWYSSFIRPVGVPLLNITLLAVASTVNVTVAKAVIINIFSSTVIFLMGIHFWKKCVPEIIGRRSDFSLKHLFDVSLPLLWVSSMNSVLSFTDTIMLGYYKDSHSVGLYAIAARLGGMIGFLLIAVNATLAPRFAALYAQGKMIELDRLARKSAFLITVSAVPLLVPFIIWPADILNLFGKEFAGASWVLIIIAFGQFISVASGSVGYLLIMSGHEKIVQNIMVFTTFLNISLNVVLIKHFGIVGAAIATGFSLAAKNIIAVTMVYRKLGISILPIPRGALRYGQ